LTAHLVIARARIVSTGSDIDYVLRMGTERTKTVNGLQAKLYQRALEPTLITQVCSCEGVDTLKKLRL
jgi:Tfp pilus assembly protein PilW